MDKFIANLMGVSVRILMMGCGFVGSRVAAQLAARHKDVEFTVADKNLAAAQALVKRMGSHARAIEIDINNSEMLHAALKNKDLVFNAVGPFHKTALVVIEGAIAAGVNYMDINDDHDVAARLTFDPSFHQRAIEAGIKIVIGCGSTPGFSNILARSGVNRLDRISSIQLCWLSPFAPHMFSPSVWDHLFHILDGEVTQYLGGKYQKVPAYSGRKQITFQPPFGTYNAYYSGHGEATTIPHFISVADEVSVRSSFFPAAGDGCMHDLVKFGFGDREVIPSIGISPLQFFIGYAASERASARLAIDLSGEPPGYATHVEVAGSRGDEEVLLTLETQGFYDEALRQIADGADPLEVVVDPTPTCARLMVECMLRGEISGCGFLAPEACIDPDSFIRNAARETGVNIYEQEQISRPNRFR